MRVYLMDSFEPLGESMPHSDGDIGESLFALYSLVHCRPDIVEQSIQSWLF